MSLRDTDPWFVYALVDPRDEAIFYIGCSVGLSARLRCHASSAGSPAQPRIRELRALGLTVEIRELSRHTEKWSALNEEEHLIESLPRLVNRAIPGMRCEFVGYRRRPRNQRVYASLSLRLNCR